MITKIPVAIQIKPWFIQEIYTKVVEDVQYYFYGKTENDGKEMVVKRHVTRVGICQQLVAFLEKHLQMKSEYQGECLEEDGSFIYLTFVKESVSRMKIVILEEHLDILKASIEFNIAFDRASHSEEGERLQKMKYLSKSLKDSFAIRTLLEKVLYSEEFAMNYLYPFPEKVVKYDIINKETNPERK